MLYAQSGELFSFLGVNMDSVTKLISVTQSSLFYLQWVQMIQHDSIDFNFIKLSLT